MTYRFQDCRNARKAVLRLRTYSLVISMTGVIDPV